MKQNEDLSNNPANKNLSEEESAAFQDNAAELEHIFRGTGSVGLIPDTKEIVAGQHRDFKRITGRELLTQVILILLITGVLLVNKSIYPAWKDHSYVFTPNANTTPKTETPPLIANEYIVGAQTHETNHRSSGKYPSNNKIAMLNSWNTYSPSNCDSIWISIELPNIKETLISEPESNTNISNNRFFDFRDKINNHWVLLKNVPLKSTNTITNDSDLLFSYSGHNYKSEPQVLTINSYKGKEITIWNSFINGYLNTGLQIEKGMTFFISSSGTIASSICPATFNSEGSLKNDYIDYQPLIDKYPTGALLFRLGDSDEWKPYADFPAGVIADKDGVLEFTINLNRIEKDLIGNFSVSVSTSRLNDHE